QADGMPHREHVEGAAELQAARLGGEPERELDEVREALVALVLEVVLGGPERVIAEVVHQLGDVARGEKRLGEPLAAVAPRVRRAPLPPVFPPLRLAGGGPVNPLDPPAFPPPPIPGVGPGPWPGPPPPR